MDRNTDQEVLRQFHRIGRTFSYETHYTHPAANGDVNEETSLLRGGTGRPNGTAGHSYTRDFFFNSAYTPGTDSPRPWVKYPAHVWHVTKAVLLSSKSCHVLAAPQRVANPILTPLRQARSTYFSFSYLLESSLARQDGTL